MNCIIKNSFKIISLSVVLFFYNSQKIHASEETSINTTQTEPGEQAHIEQTEITQQVAEPTLFKNEPQLMQENTHAANSTEQPSVQEKQPENITTQEPVVVTKIVKVYPVFDAAQVGIEKIKTAAMSMIDYVYEFFKRK